MPATIASHPYGTLSDGRKVEKWTLGGAGGLVLEFLTYGGIVTRLFAPDRNGKSEDVVLGVPSLADYQLRHPYFGAITGRVAGRITDGKFELDGKTYNLVINDPPNHLHGGTEGFDRKVWTATQQQRTDHAPSVRLTYTSPDGAEGYPGTLAVAITYTVTHDNSFVIESEVSTDRATPVNLTHHSYFNLAGESAGSIDDHVLQINSDQAIAVNDYMTLLGRHEPVAGKGNDFNQPRRLADAIPGLHKNHGDAYLVRRASGAPSLVTAARVTEPTTRRVLEVITDELYLQFYTGVSLDGSFIGKSGKPYGKHAAFCLEAQGYADGANNSALGNFILRPGTVQRRTTQYRFSTL